MEKIEALFLFALRSALRGEKVDMELTREEWVAMLRLARVHKVLPLVLDVIHGCPSLQSLGEELALMKRQVRHQVMMQTLRTGEFLELNRELLEKGIRPLVVKGLVCRELYPKPDHRPSGDEDVLVEPAQFELCCGILTEMGLESPGNPEKNASEIPFRKPDSPLYIELHKSLFPPEAEAVNHWNGFFEGVFQRAVERQIQGNRILTMCPTDHMLYLLCHAFKHFLHSGFGIRQVCDIVLFARQYGLEVDWEQIYVNCSEIRGLKFAAAIFRIGEKHLGIPAPEIFREMEVDEEPMLGDLLRGGLYGDATLSRIHSSNIILDAVEAEKQGTRPRSVLRTSLFPSAEALAGKYPYLKKRPWLLPLAWVQRIGKYSRELRTESGSSAAEALKIGSERLELMRYYDILN